MRGTYTSWNALKTALQEELEEAIGEAVQEIYADLQANVSHFYDKPEGRYHRTEKLKNSQKCECLASGNSAIGEVYLDTSFDYTPSGRDTETIFQYAEAGGLIGNGGFWKETQDRAKEHIEDAQRIITIETGKLLKRKKKY